MTKKWVVVTIMVHKYLYLRDYKS